MAHLVEEVAPRPSRSRARCRRRPARPAPIRGGRRIPSASPWKCDLDPGGLQPGRLEPRRPPIAPAPAVRESPPETSTSRPDRHRGRVAPASAATTSRVPRRARSESHEPTDRAHARTVEPGSCSARCGTRVSLAERSFQRSFSDRADAAAVNARTPADQGIPIPATRGYRRPVEFRVLGSIEVFEEGNGPIALGGPKQRAVLAHLLLRANHLVPTDVLIDEVWGEEPPETARNALQSYASHLRKALGAERLEGSRAGYRLRAEPSELDAMRFQSLLRDARRLAPDRRQGGRRRVRPRPRPLARPGVRRSRHRTVAARRGGAVRRAAARRPRGPDRGAARDRRNSGGDRRARGPHRSPPAPGALLGAADARALPVRPPGLRRSRRTSGPARSWPTSSGSIPRPSCAGCTNASSPRAPTWTRAESRCAGTGCSNASARTRSASSTGRRSRTSAARSRSGSCTSTGRTIRRSSAGSIPKRRPSPRSSIPMSRAVYDYWREPGRAYVVTRFLRGGSLRELVDRSGRAPARAGDAGSSSRSPPPWRRPTGGASAHGDLGPRTCSSTRRERLPHGLLHRTRQRLGRSDDLEAFAALARETLGERLPMARR